MVRTYVATVSGDMFSSPAPNSLGVSSCVSAKDPLSCMRAVKGPWADPEALRDLPGLASILRTHAETRDSRSNQQPERGKVPYHTVLF